MNKALIDHLSTIIGDPIHTFSSLSGGDISAAYRLGGSKSDYFAKVNDDIDAYDMFLAEADGLATLNKCTTIGVPQVIQLGTFESWSYLILSYIPICHHKDGQQALGYGIADLHNLPVGQLYGWGSNNFLGRLPQQNIKSTSWPTFFYEYRLSPLLRQASNLGLIGSYSSSRILSVLESVLTNRQPSLLHGDLWRGNYAIDHEGNAWIFDPAVYLGDAEIDLAMSRLFGGFSDTFYQSYHEKRPQISGNEVRQDIYQLYYLLSHLVMFGTSYRGGVIRIMDYYFGPPSNL